MSRRRHDHRPTYERSGRVDWLRFFPVSLVTFLVAATMGYVWFLAYDAELGYWLVTPVLLVVPVAIAGYIAVAVGRCRNRGVAVMLGLAAALVFHLSCFHADLVSQQGREALLAVDRLPDFIAGRMATDRVEAERQMLPHNETYNWLYTGAELLLISFVVAGATVFRSLKGYCESCHRWMRSVAFNAEPGGGVDIADALATGRLDEIPVTKGQSVRFAVPQSWLEFEYCPGVLERRSDCAAYLTLKDHLGLTEHAEVLMYQGRLASDEMAALAARVKGLAFLGVSAPAAEPDETSPGRSIQRHTGAVAAIERLPNEPGGAQLDRAGKVQIGLALVPIVALLGGIGLIVAGWFVDGPAGLILLAAGVVAAFAGALVCWINVDYFGMVYTDRWIRRLISYGADPIVRADESPDRFIDVVPRAQWHQLLPDKPADCGLLQIDSARDRILFEGLKERYVIPADSVLDCKVEAMLPHTGNWNLYAVVLTVRYPAGAPASVTGGRRDDEWEIPLLPRTTRFRRYNSAYRRELAEELRDEIEELLDQGDTESRNEQEGRKM